MRKAVLPFVLSVGLLVVWVAPADAASTRAEYIAQVDPICQSANVAMYQAAKGLQRDKKLGRFKVAAQKIRAEVAIFSPAVEQIAAVEPPPTDAQLIGTWVQLLRSEIPVAKRLAKDYAHGHLRTKAYFRLGTLTTESEALVADFGYQHCQRM